MIIVVRNHIHLIGEIDDRLAVEFDNKFELALSFPSKSIHLHLSSPATEKILVKIQLSYKPVYVNIHNASVYYQYTGVASAASLIASYASKKIIDYNATFMIHHARQIIKDQNDVLYWAEKTGLDYDIVDHLIKSEKVMDASCAKDFGFVDDINYNLYSLPLTA